MSTCYILDDTGFDNLTYNDLEFLSKDDKLYIISSSIRKSKKNKKMLSYLEILKNKLEKLEIVKVKYDVGDCCDFEIVPNIAIESNLSDEVVVISTNKRFFCLASYAKNYYNGNIYMAPTIKIFNCAKYLTENILFNSLEDSIIYLQNIVLYGDNYIFDLYKKFVSVYEKDLRFSEILNDFLEDSKEKYVNLRLYFYKSDMEEYKNFIDNFFEGCENKEEKIKSVYKFLKKSETYDKFKERICSCNSIFDSVLDKSKFFESFLELVILNNEKKIA